MPEDPGPGSRQICVLLERIATALERGVVISVSPPFITTPQNNEITTTIETPERSEGRVDPSLPPEVPSPPFSNVFEARGYLLQLLSLHQLDRVSYAEIARAKDAIGSTSCPHAVANMTADAVLEQAHRTWKRSVK